MVEFHSAGSICLTAAGAIRRRPFVNGSFATKQTTVGVLSMAMLLGVAGFAHGGPFLLPAQTSDQNPLDLGAFPGGTALHIQMSGTIDLASGSGVNWMTAPDGSVVSVVNAPYSYVNPGATNYPTVNGGDGIKRRRTRQTQQRSASVLLLARSATRPRATTGSSSVWA